MGKETPLGVATIYFAGDGTLIYTYKSNDYFISNGFNMPLN